MKATGQQPDPSPKKSLRDAHRRIKSLIGPPAQEHLKTIPDSEVVQEWQQADNTRQPDPTKAVEPRSGMTFAQHRAGLRKSDEKVLGQIYNRRLQPWLTGWIPEHHAELASIEGTHPMGLQHPSIVSFSRDACKRAAHRIIKAFPHLFEDNPATDPATVELVHRMGIQTQYSPWNSSEHLQVRYYRAVAQARQALQYFADHQTAVAVWYAAVIRRQPDVQLPDDRETLLLRACHQSGLSPHEWDIISEFNPSLIASTMLKNPPQAAAIAWATLADLPQQPPVDAVNTAAKQLARLHAKLPGQTPLRTFQPVIRSFYIRCTQQTHDGPEQTPFPAHQLIREARQRRLAAHASRMLAATLEAAQSILANSEQSPAPRMTWEEWLQHAGLPPQQPDASGAHGEPTHRTAEILSIPPLDPDELRERTAPKPPGTPTGGWLQELNAPGDTRMYGSASQLRRRGWTDKLVGDLLGEPDRTEPNPVYPNTASMRMYERQRVEAAEQSPAFIQHLNKYANRRRTAARAAQDRRNDAIRWAAETPVHWVCPTQSFDELRAASRINSYHDSAGQQCINFVINHCSDFQAAAAQARGMTGKSQADAVLITRICNELSRHWPQLRDACERRIMDDLSE